jgi:hypothetical protein
MKTHFTKPSVRILAAVLLALPMVLLPELVFGQPARPPIPPGSMAVQFWVNTCWAGIACIDFNTLGLKFNDAFFLAAASISLMVFIIGAFMMTISTGNDTLLQNARRAMKGSLIGIALVVGSYGLWRTIVFLLY